MTTFNAWKDTVKFLIEMAGADPDAISFDYGRYFRDNWGAMDAARQYLITLQQSLKGCGNN